MLAQQADKSPLPASRTQGNHDYGKSDYLEPRGCVFVGKARELGGLERELSRPAPSLVGVYGRRPVGKSTLILRVLEGKLHVYYQATRVTDADNQELLKGETQRALGGDPVLAGLSGDVTIDLRRCTASMKRRRAQPDGDSHRIDDRHAAEADGAPGPSLAQARYTARQGQYLAFIFYYTKIHGIPPAEADLQRYFRVSAPTVHAMLVSLEEKGLIARTPRMPRSIRLRLERHELPDLE
jgi:hypothetical protein